MPVTRRAKPENPKQKGKDTPLQTNIENDQIVIRIGIETQAWCALAKNGGKLQENLRVSDPLQFAKDVIRELERESETGETLLTNALDAAREAAVDQGSTAIRALKRKPRMLY